MDADFHTMIGPRSTGAYMEMLHRKEGHIGHVGSGILFASVLGYPFCTLETTVIA